MSLPTTRMPTTDTLRLTSKQPRAASTVSNLIEAAITERGESGLRLDSVLAESSTSLGSLYHHFQSRDGLIDAARLTQFSRATAADLEIVCETLGAATSLDDLITRFCFATLCSLNEDRTTIRFERVAMLGGASTRPALRAGLAGEQHAATERLTACLADLRDRGVIPHGPPLRTVAVFMQAVILGQVLIDLDTEPTDPGQWVALVGSALRGVLGVAG